MFGFNLATLENDENVADVLKNKGMMTVLIFHYLGHSVFRLVTVHSVDWRDKIRQRFDKEPVHILADIWKCHKRQKDGEQFEIFLLGIESFRTEDCLRGKLQDRKSVFVFCSVFLRSRNLSRRNQSNEVLYKMNLMQLFYLQSAVAAPCSMPYCFSSFWAKPHVCYFYPS